MKCENCPAMHTFFDGVETVGYCYIGISEEEAEHDWDWYCRFNRKTIEKRIRDIDAEKEKETQRIINMMNQKERK